MDIGTVMSHKRLKRVLCLHSPIRSGNSWSKGVVPTVQACGPPRLPAQGSGRPHPRQPAGQATAFPIPQRGELPLLDLPTGDSPWRTTLLGSKVGPEMVSEARIVIFGICRSHVGSSLLPFWIEPVPLAPRRSEEASECLHMDLAYGMGCAYACIHMDSQQKWT